MQTDSVAHITMFFGNQLGVINKLERLAKTCVENQYKMEYVWLTSDNKDFSNLKYLKVLTVKHSKNVFRMRIDQVKILNQISQDYSKIIMRYPLFDPILYFFLKDKHKYIFEHHTKETDELFLKKDPRYIFEKYLGSKWLNLFGGIIGVTEEIKRYEIERSNYKGFSTFCPNSIAIDEKKRVDGQIYSDELLHIIFVANFRPWHGLDIVLKEVNADIKYKGKYRLHVIGHISSHKDLEIVNNNEHIKYYGELKKEQIEEIYQKMDIGLGVFNVEIKNLSQSTSLKVREYLANGIPVFTGDEDPVFPVDYPYVKQQQSFKLENIFNFAEELKGRSRNDILQSSSKYIDSKYILKNLLIDIENYEE